MRAGRDESSELFDVGFVCLVSNASALLITVIHHRYSSLQHHPDDRNHLGGASLASELAEEEQSEISDAQRVEGVARGEAEPLHPSSPTWSVISRRRSSGSRDETHFLELGHDAVNGRRRDLFDGREFTQGERPADVDPDRREGVVAEMTAVASPG
jgi:hypothetical protein